MKRLYIFGTALLMVIGTSGFAANNFTVLPSDSISMTAACGSVATAAHVNINNTTGGKLKLSYEVIVNTLVQDTNCWHLQLCDNLTCFPYIPSGQQTLWDLNSGVNNNVFILDVTPKNVKHNGQLKIRVFETATPSNADTITFDVIGCSSGGFCATGVEEEVDLDKAVSVYPIPAGNSINLDIDDPNFDPSINVEIFNVLGEKVKVLSLNEGKHNKVDITALRSGVYFVRYENSKGRVAVKKFYKDSSL